MGAHLIKLKNTIEIIPISTSECEKGFSQMNMVVSPLRSSMHTSTASDILFIRITGPPLRKFNPRKYVESWLLEGRHSAIDSQSKKRKKVNSMTPGIITNF